MDTFPNPNFGVRLIPSFPISLFYKNGQRVDGPWNDILNWELMVTANGG